jgi:hypothetical protein
MMVMDRVCPENSVALVFFGYRKRRGEASFPRAAIKDN